MHIGLVRRTSDFCASSESETSVGVSAGANSEAAAALSLWILLVGLIFRPRWVEECKEEALGFNEFEVLMGVKQGFWEVKEGNDKMLFAVGWTGIDNIMLFSLYTHTQSRERRRPREFLYMKGSHCHWQMNKTPSVTWIRYRPSGHWANINGPNLEMYVRWHNEPYFTRAGPMAGWLDLIYLTLSDRNFKWDESLVTSTHIPDKL